MERVVDQENSEYAINIYDNFVSAEICLLDERDRTMMARVNKSGKDNESNPR